MVFPIQRGARLEAPRELGAAGFALNSAAQCARFPLAHRRKVNLARPATWHLLPQSNLRIDVDSSMLAADRSAARAAEIPEDDRTRQR